MARTYHNITYPDTKIYYTPTGKDIINRLEYYVTTDRYDPTFACYHFNGFYFQGKPMVGGVRKYHSNMWYSKPATLSDDTTDTIHSRLHCDPLAAVGTCLPDSIYHRWNRAHITTQDFPITSSYIISFNFNNQTTTVEYDSTSFTFDGLCFILFLNAAGGKGGPGNLWDEGAGGGGGAGCILAISGLGSIKRYKINISSGNVSLLGQNGTSFSTLISLSPGGNGDNKVGGYGGSVTKRNINSSLDSCRIIAAHNGGAGGGDKSKQGESVSYTVDYKNWFHPNDQEFVQNETITHDGGDPVEAASGGASMFGNGGDAGYLAGPDGHEVWPQPGFLGSGGGGGRAHPLGSTGAAGGPPYISVTYMNYS